MSIITIDLGDPVNPPDYNPLFDFIDSEEGHKYLLKAERGNHSFRSALQTLKSIGALPTDSSKRVWHPIRMMYTKTQPLSILSYE